MHKKTRDLLKQAAQAGAGMLGLCEQALCSAMLNCSQPPSNFPPRLRQKLRYTSLPWTEGRPFWMGSLTSKQWGEWPAKQRHLTPFQGRTPGEDPKPTLWKHWGFHNNWVREDAQHRKATAGAWAKLLPKLVCPLMKWMGGERGERTSPRLNCNYAPWEESESYFICMQDIWLFIFNPTTPHLTKRL